ncbi:MAG: Ig-like domain-containing protein, partial [Candidatus Zixiibacteriota bacterium]
YTGSRILADAIRSPQSSLDNEIGAALTGFFNTFTPLLPAGDGLWATLWFTASPTAANRVIVIDSAFVAPAGEFVLVDSNGTPFTPEFIPGSVTIAINTPPTIDPIPGPTQVDENMTLSFTVTASDAESVPTLSAVDLPVNASFNDNENGTGSFTFTPDFTQAGVYPVTFIASDGPLADSATVDITVINVNRTPSIPIILKQIAFVGEPYTLVVSSTDPDDDPLVLAANNIPFGALFVDSGNGVGVLTFTPQTSHIQTYDVVFVYSDGFASPSQTVRLSVVQRCALTFFADFALDQINTRPDSTLPGSVVGDSLSAQLPGPNGVVLVRQSVGDMLNKPCEIVDSPLTQGVFLRGFVAPAGLCSYQEVSWQSLVTDNINKFSGCELRDAGGLVIGFLSYTFNGLLITGTAPGSPNITLSAKYTPNVAQNFVIEIDYTNRTITLSVDGETQVATLPFYQSTAGKLATVTFNAQGLFASQQTSLVVDNIQVSGGGGF